jgi:flagellar hook protein FlgE
MKYIRSFGDLMGNELTDYIKKFEINDILLLRDLLKRIPKYRYKYIKEDNSDKDEIKVYDLEEGELVTISKAKIKELEDKFPEILEINEEMEKFIKEFNSISDTFKNFFDELTETKGVKDALDVLIKFVKENGVLKSFKMITDMLKLLKKKIECEKKVSNIIPKGEKYILKDETENGILVIGGRPSVMENIISTISNTLTVKNLMKIMTGKTEDIEKLEVEYLKKDGNESTGELKEVEITDDGKILVSIENDKVGEIKKNITDITGEAESESEADLKKKMTEILKNKPEEVKRILKFTNFISDENNKDQVVKINKILGFK